MHIQRIYNLVQATHNPQEMETSLWNTLPISGVIYWTGENKATLYKEGKKTELFIVSTSHQLLNMVEPVFWHMPLAACWTESLVFIDNLSTDENSRCIGLYLESTANVIGQCWKQYFGSLQLLLSLWK